MLRHSRHRFQLFHRSSFQRCCGKTIAIQRLAAFILKAVGSSTSLSFTELLRAGGKYAVKNQNIGRSNFVCRADKRLTYFFYIRTFSNYNGGLLSSFYRRSKRSDSVQDGLLDVPISWTHLSNNMSRVDFILRNVVGCTAPGITALLLDLHYHVNSVLEEKELVPIL